MVGWMVLLVVKTCQGSDHLLERLVCRQDVSSLFVIEFKHVVVLRRKSGPQQLRPAKIHRGSSATLYGIIEAPVVTFKVVFPIDNEQLLVEDKACHRHIG
jgi:hypothetical protein